MKLKILPLALVLAACSSAATASINEAMNRQFGTMQNITQPAVIVGPEGGVVSGGAMRMRMPIESVTPVRITPPSVRAGCGGIDLHGGSLSFPSAQEFVQVARAVAGNVGGYAFKLALSSMCQNCENIMSAIQETNNMFNRMDLDSCTIAQDIVANQGDTVRNQAESSLSRVGTAWASVFASDRHEARGTGREESPAASMPIEDRAAAFEGNYIWDALPRDRALIPGMPNNNESREIIMSMIGSFVMCSQGVDGCPEFNPGEREGEGGAQRLSAKLTLNELLAGGRQEVFDCRDDRCLDVGTTTVDLGPSMVRQMEDAFLLRDGILDRLSAPSAASVPLTDQQSNWLSLLGTSGDGVIDLAASGQQNRVKAEIFVRDAARTILATYYANMVLDVIRQVRRQVEVDPRPGRSESIKLLEETRSAIQADLAAHGDIVSQELMLLEFRKKLMASMAARIGVLNATAAEIPVAGR